MRILLLALLSVAALFAVGAPLPSAPKEEPLANLLEVMRHLMSHNGHLKTAIVP